MPLPVIGVFDSGLGGLTGFRKLRELLPDHPLVYFGDTARVPYGTKSNDTIVRFAKQDVRFLLSQSASSVFIACGTVSSVALDDLRATFGIPFTGVVEPAAREAFRIASSKEGKVLILGTDATIRSRSYESKLITLDRGLSIRKKACPLFVPLAENLHAGRGDRAAEAAAHSYLDEFVDFRPDVIILGCTHFPLLSDIISDILPDSALISAGEEAAKEVAAAVSKSPSRRRKNASLSCVKEAFFTSGDADTFASDASVYLGRKIEKAEHVDIESFEEDT